MGNENKRQAAEAQASRDAAQREFAETLPMQPGWLSDQTADGKTYYWHPDGRRQWERPTEWVAAPDQDETPPEAEGPLPSGWHEDFGGKLGENKRFYWHDDGRRQWERPQPSEDAAGAGGELPTGWHADVAGPGSTKPGATFWWHDDGRRTWEHPGGGASEPDMPLPPGWHRDTAGPGAAKPGQTFYWHDDGRRQWEHPDPPKPDGPVEDPLPAGWKKGIAGPGSKKPGAVFYYHEDGRKTWESPVLPDIKPVPTAPGEDQPGPDPKADGTTSGASSEEQLPAGWSQATTPDGKTYYYNAQNKRQWQKPTAADDPNAA